MNIEEFSLIVDDLARDIIFCSEATTPADFSSLADRLGKIHDEAEDAGWQSASDAAGLGQQLAKRLASDENMSRRAALGYLATLIEVLHTASTELEKGGTVTSAFKAQLSGVRVFLQDIEAEPAPAPQASAPSDDFAEFRGDMLNRVDTVENTLLGLAEGASNPEAMAGIFREFHTLKGEAGMLGLAELNRFFHKVEDALDPARKRPMAATEDFIAAMMKLAGLSRKLLNQEMVNFHIDQAECKSLAAALSTAISAAPDGTPPPPPEAVDESFFAAMSEANEPSAAADGGEGKAAVSAEVGGAEVASSKAERGIQGEAVLVEEDVPEAEAAYSITMDVRRIDSLLEMVGMVATVGGQVAHHPAVLASTDAALTQDVTQLRRAIQGLQSMAMELRMVPIAQLFQRMKRVAFDVCRSSHKKVNVVFEGADTEVDRMLVNDLGGALVHLIRNAIDHGIEDTDERRTANKPERGTLTLRASRQSNDTVVEVKEDGRGIDVARVRARAEDMGLISKDAVLDDSEIRSLIFHSGFSTATRVTNFSGRGVGMDAVRSAVAALRGKIDVESEVGVGTTIRMILPALLSAFDGLVVRVGEGRYILPVASVRESFRPGPGQVSGVEGKGLVVNVRGCVLPIISLADELGMKGDAKAPEEGLLVILEQGGEMGALMVDEVLATRQVMVRPIENSLDKSRHVSGAALLENRRVALVLDARELMASGSVSNRNGLGGMSTSEDRIETIEIGFNRVGMVDFHINHIKNGALMRGRFAINAFKAREFVPRKELLPLPHAPKGFAGMLLLREKTIPVISLLDCLGFERCDEPEGSIIICEFAGRTVGMLVHGVNRVNYITWQAIMPPPETGGNTPYTVGTILMGGDVVFVLDFERIVQEVLCIYGEVDLGLVESRKTGSRILLVEDSSIIRKQTCNALRGAGLVVEEACDGQEALERLEAWSKETEQEGVSIFEKLDLVLSDIEMPRLDGYTLTRTLKSHPRLRLLPVVLHSSLTNETIVRRAQEVHADGFVSKMNPGELSRELRRYL